jgi:hypothetical protein
VTLLLPKEAFPGPATAIRDELVRSWQAGPVADALPSGMSAGLVVLVSAESPGQLGARLRELARHPEMRGKLLAAWSLSGPVRQDLPASLLREDNLAGLGLAEPGVVSGRGAASGLSALSDALQATEARGQKVERLSGSFLWFF